MCFVNLCIYDDKFETRIDFIMLPIEQSYCVTYAEILDYECFNVSRHIHVVCTMWLEKLDSSYLHNHFDIKLLLILTGTVSSKVKYYFTVLRLT